MNNIINVLLKDCTTFLTIALDQLALMLTGSLSYVVHIVVQWNLHVYNGLSWAKSQWLY